MGPGRRVGVVRIRRWGASSCFRVSTSKVPDRFATSGSPDSALGRLILFFVTVPGTVTGLRTPRGSTLVGTTFGA